MIDKIETPIAEYLPHAGSMVLLDELVSVRKEGLTAALTVRQDGLFDSNETVPAWLGMEYMAQAIAAFSGYASREAGEPVKLGFLVSTRRFTCNSDILVCGTRLNVNINRVLQAENGMASFDCEVEGKGVQQQARINVYQPDDVEAFLKGDQQ
jgi:predicted hotdog family 3-hydroxylacyl-ACP dehydratase